MALSPNYNSAYFIAGIDTDIGKTFLVENLCRILLQKNIPVAAIKPIASGFSDDDLNSDSARILESLNQKISSENINKITPWRFVEATSPHFAAKKINQEIDFLQVVNFCKKNLLEAQATNTTLFIEAAGGVMTPINDEKTFLDLAFELKIPVLLLSANYLGSISHTLCAVEILKKNKIFVEKIIINDDLSTLKKSSAAPTSEVIKTIEKHSSVATTTVNNFLNF